ncbi:hypothetical protein CLCR_07787 [Cladophialophora carrionii]|uniref:Uncharacterized protein n=1 Tax=Cladophialophora carrionii TaxID=86049 RepID=A0A1C1CQ09_9EURO|nr:hypothetical protein CLCR_07787 [Cladophialophora carrionii]
MATRDSEVDAHRVCDERLHNGQLVSTLGDDLNDGPAQAAVDVGIHFSSPPLSSWSFMRPTSTIAIGTSANDTMVMTSDFAPVPKLVTIHWCKEDGIHDERCCTMQ